MVGVFVVLLMMVLLVAGCTDEAVGTVEVVGGNEVFNTDAVEIVEVLADEVDIINDTDIIDEVVNTVDVSDTNDE